MIIPLILAAALLVQDTPPDEPPTTSAEAPMTEGPADALVESIQDNLTHIDELLLETADADEQIAPSLESVREMHREVIRDLDELIKQARYRKSKQSSGGGSDSQSQSQSQPPPRESDGSRQPGSADEPQSQEQQQQGQQEQGEQNEQQQQQGERPEDGANDDGSARQQDAQGEPPPDQIGDFTRQDTDGRWGLLPPKLQERLMNLHVDAVPERYRAWLTAYIRSMQRLEQPGSGSDDG